MATPTFNAVGFCAHYSESGDRAFDYALELTRRHGIQLNVFHFLSDPWDPTDEAPTGLSHDEMKRLVVDRERELRMYYDSRAGDYLEVGFRLCENNEWLELHRCLLVHEFQILVLGNPGPGTIFAGKPIEEFAYGFVAPVVLVGPPGEEQFLLNSQAAMINDVLGIPEGAWTKIEPVTT